MSIVRSSLILCNPYSRTLLVQYHSSSLLIKARTCARSTSQVTVISSWSRIVFRTLINSLTTAITVTALLVLPTVNQVLAQETRSKSCKALLLTKEFLSSITSLNLSSLRTLLCSRRTKSWRVLLTSSLTSCTIRRMLRRLYTSRVYLLIAQKERLLTCSGRSPASSNFASYHGKLKMVRKFTSASLTSRI